MANISPALLSNRDLLDATVHAVDRERHTTAELLALLAELDTRRRPVPRSLTLQSLR